MLKKIVPLIFIFLLFYACAQRFSSRYESNPHTHQEGLLQHVAEDWVGTPYLYGGNDKAGIDCSGLAVNIFRQVYGIELPRSTKRLRRLGHSVGARYARPGDLLFFRMKKYEPLNHVGIYLGKGRFIHASSSRGVVISSLNDPFYRKNLVTARRIRK